MLLCDVRPRDHVFAIDNAQNVVRGRLLGTRGSRLAILTPRGVVRLFHPRYVSPDAWAVLTGGAS
jgi:hypothetical protein